MTDAKLVVNQDLETAMLIHVEAVTTRAKLAYLVDDASDQLLELCAGDQPPSAGYTMRVQSGDALRVDSWQIFSTRLAGKLGVEIEAIFI